MRRTAALVAVYLLLASATLALVATATGPPITVWRVLAYVLLPVLVVWLSRRLGSFWAVTPLVAALLVDRLVAADVFGAVDGWYCIGLVPYALLLATIHLGTRTARVVQTRARAQDAY